MVNTLASAFWQLNKIILIKPTLKKYAIQHMQFSLHKIHFFSLVLLLKFFKISTPSLQINEGVDIKYPINFSI